MSFLLTGDMEEEAEAVLLCSGVPLRSTVLKAPHHTQCPAQPTVCADGSQTSLSAEFLAAVDPQLVIISCGADNEFGHPHVETLDKLERAGCTVLRTDQGSTVEVVTDGKGLWVHTQSTRFAR